MMRLSQLTIKGFKSFADETVINFGEQVIGVVGPNGSGKSNIVDSIKWVLGEGKTKELRLDSMQDVIFAGTKSRKPGKVARVSLNFDNTKNILPTEYNNVTISRLLYSNGQSEYRLNDVVCRKRDITSLFLDSGMGSNAYAIISLSMVEDILVDRENSRGKMIEEASGINKFKVRKRETLNKLKGTQVDLDRVEDLLFELEANLKAFEKQARRTERYMKVKEEFRLTSLSWATRSTGKLKSEVAELQTKLNNDEKTEIAISTELNNKEAELQKVKKEVLEKEGQLSDFQKAHNKLKEQISALESRKGIAQNEMTFLNSGLQIAEKENSTISSDTKSLKINLEEKSKISKEKKEALDLKNREYEKIVHSYNAVKEVYDSIRENLVSEQKEKSELRNKIDQSKRNIGIKQNEISLLQNQLSLSNTELNNLQNKLKNLQDQLTSLTNKKEKAVEVYEKAFAEAQDLKAQTEERKAIIEEKKEEQRRLSLRLDKLLQRVELLTNMIENYEGFTEAIQYLNNESKINKQTIADVLTIQSSEYQSIVEFFFEPILQHIIVDSEAEAYNLHNLIKSAQKGKVNVFITQYEKPSNKNLGADFIPLVDLIEVGAPYDKSISFITNDVYVYTKSFNDLPTDQIDDDVSILLPHEQMIFSNKELRGGSVTLFEGVNIGRRKNLEELNKRSDNLKSELADLEVILKKEEELLEKLEKQLADQNEKVKNADQEKLDANNALNTLQAECDIHSKLTEEARSKNVKSVAHIENMKGELDALIKLNESFSVDTLDENDMEKLRVDFEKYHTDFEKSRAEKEERHQEIINDQNQIRLIERDIEQIETSIQEKINREKEHTQTIKTNNERISVLMQELNQIKEKSIKLYSSEKKQFEDLNSQEEAFFSAKSGIFEQEKNIFELRGKREKAQHLISNLKEKISEKNIKMTSWKDRMEVEFNEDINRYEVPEEYTEIDLDQLGVSREQLQVRLRSFGDINPLAIEAYNEIQFRVEKIAAERDDILKAKENLEETIRDIEETASNLFTESLDKIRVHFKEVFRSLFSEDDDCDIVLLNADNPLESSIEIIAKPKGKKPKSINQLSGGEKTLTAVSFLFSLYLLKPAPFCIFDEVDAPLDDVNIQKFNNIIRTFSKDSQFIIVTHNKATMAEMDILYGVFMQEMGVSGVAAVDFREFNKIDLFSPN